jgi:hypothetical protein
MSAEVPLTTPLVDKHGNIVVTPHQVLEQVVDNATRIEGQAQHNAALTDETIRLAQPNSAIMDETLCLREE